MAANIDVLADELGLALTVMATEVSVGDFRLDIKAEDEDGRVVVIENQLERTDHGHLGQCLVYASGLEASTVVWVSSHFRDEFRRALDWLNERTDLGVNFVGVEVGVVQIGDTGPRAPVFEVVSRPNDWQKSVKENSSGSSGTSEAVTPANAARQDFYAQVLNQVVASRPSIRMPARARGHWLAFSSGPFGYWAISVAADGQLRLEAYLDTGNKDLNKRLFGELYQQRTELESNLGFSLSWERLDDKRASRIAAYRSFTLDDETVRQEAYDWAVVTLLALHGCLNDSLRGRAKALKDAADLSQDAVDSAAHDAADSAFLHES